MNAVAPSTPPPAIAAPRLVRGAAPSFENAPQQRRQASQARSAALRLGPRERAELEYFWGGYEADIGCQSLHGSTTDRLLRSPPAPQARTLILDELARFGGSSNEGKLLELLAVEQWATRYELDRAVRCLLERGSVRRDDAGVLHLAAAPTLPSTTREERWQRADAELEAYCSTLSVGDDSRSKAVDTLGPERWLSVGGRIDSPQQRMFARTVQALRRIAPVHAIVLHRVYGYPDPSSRYDVFGRELAPLAEYTAPVDQARRLLVQARVASALKVARDAFERESGFRIRMLRDLQPQADELVAKAEHASARVAKSKSKEANLDGEKLEARRAKTATYLALLERTRDRHAKLAARVPSSVTPVDETAIRVGADRAVTTAMVLRERLDVAPARRENEGDAAFKLRRVAWKVERTAFVEAVKRDAERMLIEACNAYREARRRS